MATIQDSDRQRLQETESERAHEALARAFSRKSEAHAYCDYAGKVPISIFHDVPTNDYPLPVTIRFEEVVPQKGDTVLARLRSSTKAYHGNTEYILLPVIYLGTDDSGRQQVQLARPLAQIQWEGDPLIDITILQTEYSFGENFDGIHTIGNHGFTGYYMPTELELNLPSEGEPIYLP